MLRTLKVPENERESHLEGNPRFRSALSTVRENCCVFSLQSGLTGMLKDLQNDDGQFMQIVPLCQSVIVQQAEKLANIEEFLARYGYKAPNPSCTQVKSESSPSTITTGAHCFGSHAFNCKCLSAGGFSLVFHVMSSRCQLCFLVNGHTANQKLNLFFFFFFFCHL